LLGYMRCPYICYIVLNHQNYIIYALSLHMLYSFDDLKQCVHNFAASC